MAIRMVALWVSLSLTTSWVAGCGGTDSSATEGEGGGGAADEKRPAPELGSGDRSPASVTFTAIATNADRLAMPRDLAFNPRVPGELWILNDKDESVTIVHDATTDKRASERRKDGYAMHFMPNPAAQPVRPPMSVNSRTGLTP